MSIEKNGWIKPTATAHTYHYFDGFRSLCGGYGWIGPREMLDSGIDVHPDNCQTCQQKRAEQKALIRDVWALVTASPQLGMTDMARHLGVSSSQIARALRFLRAAGYIEFKDLRASTRRVVVPLIEVEK